MGNHQSRKKWQALLSAVLGLAGFALVYWMVWGAKDDDKESLVVYCAHDSIYSQGILDRFEQETGIRVDVKFDTEATKSLGLVEKLEAEKSAPLCDVFWNNELLGTMRLAEAGCLKRYNSPNAERIPAEFKDPDGLWTGFAGRLRVFIINKERGLLDQSAITTALESDDLSQVAIAIPLYGTTLTHYTALWAELGEAGVKEWHNETREAGLKEVNGNAVVKELVAEGVCHFGFTDTDDTFVAIDAGKPVTMEPIRLPSGKTICIPNTVSIIKGGPNPEAAQKLVDFLLSEEIELALANSRARQIPLGSISEDEKIPQEVKQIRDWAIESIDLKKLSGVRDECLQWLKTL